MDDLPSPALRSNPLPQRAPGQSDVRTGARGDTSRKAIEQAVAQLRRRAFLYDDPDAYSAGVRDALSEVNAGIDAGSESPAPSAEQ
jgi:hypothetical protein